MKAKNISLGITGITAAAMLAGCYTSTILEYDSTGKIIKRTEIKEPSLANKAVAVSGSVSAVKIETTGSTSSGTLLPNVILGGANTAVSTLPKDDDRPVFAYSSSTSILGSLTNASASNKSYTYIGTKSEKASDTAARINALTAIVGDTSTVLSESDSVDSGIATDEVK